MDGKVVGWFQGRFEWGPRALGNRSILADARRADMKHIVNSKIKFREPFRPFAPVILEERASEFFDGLSDPKRHYPARYMLLVLPWKERTGEMIPAVNHLGQDAYRRYDGSGIHVTIDLSKNSGKPRGYQS